LEAVTRAQPLPPYVTGIVETTGCTSRSRFARSVLFVRGDAVLCACRYGAPGAVSTRGRPFPVLVHAAHTGLSSSAAFGTSPAARSVTWSSSYTRGG